MLSNSKIEGTLLSISDFYLNTDESFEIYLIVDGKPSTINYHSRISGVSELMLRSTPMERHDDAIKTGIFLFSIAILFSAGATIWASISVRKLRKQEREFIQKYIDEQQEDE